MALTQVNAGLIDSTSQPNSFKNRIINGAMMIDQRNAGASVTITSSPYTIDRWRFYATQDSKFTAQQNAGSVTPPAGFSNYLGTTVTSAVSVGASDYFGLSQRVEGFNVADLTWGTANAKSITVSFWVRSSLTGTFGATIRNSAYDRSYPFTYTISSANTWEQKSVTIAGDTTGTWLTTNGVGLQLTIGLGVGSTYSGTAGSWASANYWSATGATSVVGTNGATFYITGVQLEKGSTATSFDYRPYGTELALCQRYFWKMNNNSSGTPILYTGVNSGTTTCYGSLQYPVTMRTSPSLSASSNTWGFVRNAGSFTLYDTTGYPTTSGNGYDLLTAIYAPVASGLTTAGIGQVYIYNGQWVSFNSEL